MGSKRKRVAKDGSNPASNSNKKVKNDATTSVAAVVAPKPDLENVVFVETPSADERKHEAAIYNLLGSEIESERFEAAQCIVSSLLGGEGVAEAVLKRHLDRRLLRGLASGRNASRLGFSLVITEILGQLFGKNSTDLSSKYNDLTFDKVLEFLVEKAQVVGNIPGQEERDIFFGQLFGIECFVKSRILFEDTSRWDTILNLLLSLGNRKIWLRSQCGWVIVQALDQMSQKVAETTLRKISDAGLAKTPEGVAIWLVALSQHPTLNVKPWRHPLSKKSLGDLAAVLKESFSDSAKEPTSKGRGNTAGNQKQANWTAQLHFVWDIILGHYSKENDDSEMASLDQFWSRIVDDGLFSKNATDGQKFRGFTVFQKMLEGLAEQHANLKLLFSKNLMTCLMNQAAKEDRYLNRAATKVLKAIEGVVSSQPNSLEPVLDCLLGKNGAYNFDQRTSTRTVDKLLQSFNKENQKATMEILRRPIPSLSQLEIIEAQIILRAYIDYLSKVLNAAASAGLKGSISKKDKGSTLGFALQELSRFAYSQPTDIPDGVLISQIQELSRNRLESSLAKLTRQTDDFSTFCAAVASIDSSSVTMAEEIKSTVEGALSRMHKLLKQKTKTPNEHSLTQGLAMLHAISIFQLYNEDPDAMEVLDDLAQYHERLKKGKHDNTTGSSEFLVEILLSMVARPSSLMRQVSQQVFEAFTSQISAGGLELLTTPLASDESARGQKELFDTEEDGMDIEENESEDEDEDDVEEASDVEVASDVEFVDLNDANSEDGSGEEDEDEEEDGEAKDQESRDFDELFSKILKSHRLDKDADAESSASEGDMSDSEMMELDEKLAEVFKQRVKARPDSKRQKKDAKQSVVNFKHRILDLLDIFVKNEVVNPLCFSLLIPLLNLMRTTTIKTLASRACEIILNFQKGLKKARSAGTVGGGNSSSNSNSKDTDKEDKDDASSQSDADDDNDDLLAVLVEVHDEAGKDNSHAYAKAASAASLVVASAMFTANKESVKRTAAVYAKTQSDWVLGLIQLQNSFFADWNNWCQNHASQARS